MSDAPPKLSFGEGISDGERKAAFAVARISAHELPGTVLTLALPKEWRQAGSVPAADTESRILAAFGASESIGVQVLQIHQEFEIDLRDWLQYQAERLGMKLDAIELAATTYGDVVHAAGAGKDGGRFRLVVCGDGPELFFLIGHRGPGDSPETDAVLGLTAASFLFEQHSGRKTREQLLTYVDRRLGFEVVAPKSWSVEPDAEGVDFRVAGEGDTLAYAHVVADANKAASAGVAALLGDAIAEFERAKLTLEKLEPIPGDPAGGDRERWAGACELPKGQGQVLLLFRRVPHAWLRATVLTRNREGNPLLWMRGNRCYEIVCATLGEARHNGE